VAIVDRKKLPPLYRSFPQNLFVCCPDDLESQAFFRGAATKRLSGKQQNGDEKKDASVQKPLLNPSVFSM
jgi:hypothetical protein